EFLLPLERRGARVCRLVVDPDVSGDIRLRGREGLILEGRQCVTALCALRPKARGEVIELLLGQFARRHGRRRIAGWVSFRTNTTTTPPEIAGAASRLGVRAHDGAAARLE